MFTKLRLDRFKSFEDAEIPFGPFTVLVGANATGKSNVRDAFRFLHGISRGYSISETLGEKWGDAGYREWSGIRGGAREIAFSGTSSYAVSAEFGFPEERRPSYRIKVAAPQDPLEPP